MSANQPGSAPASISPRVEGFGAEGLPARSAGAGSAAARQPTSREAATANPNLTAIGQPSAAQLTREALRPLALPALYGSDGRLLVPAALRGSHDILLHQNLMADEAGLERIQDDTQLARMIAAHQLLALPESASLRINPELPGRRRTARPWTTRFAADTAAAFYARFHQPLQVNSAVRTVAYQLRLQRSNGNAAAVAGDTASPHLTGQAIDFGKRGMNLTEIAWMRAYLLPLIEAGQIDVEEEFQQACFHISVYRSYRAPETAPAPAFRTEIAETPRTPHAHLSAASVEALAGTTEAAPER